MHLSENIKRFRAKVDAKIVNEYLENLEISLDSISNENIANYDETYFTDDPGSTQVVVRCSRDPERTIDLSESSPSVMFAVSGDSKLFPSYTVYKLSHLYPTHLAQPLDICYSIVKEELESGFKSVEIRIQGVWKYIH